MTRLRVALAAVIIATLLPAAGVFTEVVSNPSMFRRRDDPISVFDRRLAPLREFVRTERVVGYLPPPLIKDRAAHLYSVRYALAPVQVRDDPNLPLVVADGVVYGQLVPEQMRVRHDFGDGLLLLEQVPR
jgi:hypothetical protein